MSTKLAFDHNWRRTLLLTKESTHNLEIPAEYVSLNPKTLRTSQRVFCERHWSDYQFDYDPYSYLLWPLQDTVSASQLADKLNAIFPHCASVVQISPVTAHGLEFENSPFQFDCDDID